MKLLTPPRIFWNVRGYVSESAQKKLRHEAQRQMGLLTHAMSFRGLDQGCRSRPVGGYEFRCVSVFGLNSVAITLIKKVGKRKAALKEEICWCTCQFAEGKVAYIVEAATGTGTCKPGESGYPTCAINAIEDYEGLRYGVHVCQKLRWSSFICVPTDFETYLVGDKVVVLYLDAWDPIDCECAACGVEGRDKTDDTVVEALDGQFIVMPYEFES